MTALNSTSENMANEAEQANTTPVDSGNADTTHAPSGNEGTTPPEADKTGTTPPEGGNELDVEKVVKKRLERERRKWEAEREEAERRARMDEAERLKAEIADRDKAIEAAKAEARRERTLRQLGPDKVVDAEDALLIAEKLDLVDEDGQVDVDALLKAKPHLAPQQARGVDIPGARTRPGSVITEEALRKMTPEEINDRWDEIQEALKKK